MPTIFFVIRAYRYRESQKWEYSLVKMCTDIEDAKRTYHSNMSAIIKDTNDFAMCTVIDNFGNSVEKDWLDTHTEPEPEPEEDMA